MTKMLTPAQVEQYERDGHLSPLRAFSAAEARGYRNRLEQCEQRFGPLAVGKSGSKTHVLFTWADEIVRHPAILDAVEDLIGPDILVFQLTMWIKNAHDDAIVGWHQDASYFGLDPLQEVTAWIALSDSSHTAGCVQVIPGSHHLGPLHHSVKRTPERSMLPRGQSVSTEVDTSGALGMPLSAGEFSLHHTLLVHGSQANHSDDRRIGLGISYIPTRVRYTGATRLSAKLVRGTDRYGHFDPEPRPAADFDDEARAAHEAITQTYFASKREQAELYTPIDISAA